MIVDLGTGDGRAVLARAAAEPRSLVIGVDANARSMAEASRRAERRGPRNALFVVAAAERLPTELVAIAAEVQVVLPWGSLLRGALALDPAAAAGIAALLAPGATATIVVAPAERDGLELPRLDDPTGAADLAARWRVLGVELLGLRPIELSAGPASSSTWARRLASGGNRDRRAWRIDLRRPPAAGRSPIRSGRATDRSHDSARSPI